MNLGMTFNDEIGPVFGERVRAGVAAGGAGPEDQGAEDGAPVRRGGRAAVQADRLLFERGALVRREGGHDRVRQAAHPGPGRAAEPARRHAGPGHGGGPRHGSGALLRVGHAGHHFVRVLRQSGRDRAHLPTGRCLAPRRRRLRRQLVHLPRVQVPHEGHRGWRAIFFCTYIVFFLCSSP